MDLVKIEQWRLMVLIRLRDLASHVGEEIESLEESGYGRMVDAYNDLVIAEKEVEKELQEGLKK